MKVVKCWYLSSLGRPSTSAMKLYNFGTDIENIDVGDLLLVPHDTQKYALVEVAKVLHNPSEEELTKVTKHVIDIVIKG